ncbi:cAMP-regulated phosphoprotein 21 isoform X3 [Cylas formicarius]|uniref:cAMP-regulated phosphoprotein 21 isoform X3 n=1 Tax=Cylas formicarius TaxID=197179 RepID=UPI002958849A|nr:cAMP-regulated phosphoprotein 21 isoform X3 [Cylas formicarius]
MQQRDSGTVMESKDGDQTNTPPSRGRSTSKLKVLGRSHAMREEPSPPREPTRVDNDIASATHPTSPCIKLTPSIETSLYENPLLEFSPSPVGDQNSLPSLNETDPDSSTSTLLVTQTSGFCSLVNSRDDDINVSKLDPAQTELLFNSEHCEIANTPSDQHQDKVIHTSLKNIYCDCQNQNCIKCVRDKSVNNNNHSNINNNVISSSNMLFVSRTNVRSKLRQQSSSQGSFESSSNSPCLSRDSSSEQYTDSTGIDLEHFIPETLNRNAKDRALMLRIEQELVSLAKDKTKTHYKFPPMSSYQRMLVHRCAAYFGMDHNIESSGKCVVVNKTKNMRIPEVEFKVHVKDDIVFKEEPRRSILKRDSNSIEDYCFKSPDRGYNSENRRSKSFEEREEEYEKARKRIFNREMHKGSSEEFTWSEIPWSSTESDYISKYRLHPPEFQARHVRRLLKVHSEDAVETMRPCVAKSFSFGGYGGNASGLTRGDSVMSTHSAGPRLLTKQDSGASSVSWRLSPSSSGYKSQSQMSDSVTPSPTSTPHHLGEARQDLNNSVEGHNRIISDRPENQIVWAVTDIQSVPKGSIIINPQASKSLKNEDGTIYHYDPNRPPPGFLIKPSHSSQLEINTNASLSPNQSPHREKVGRSSPKVLNSKPSKSSPTRKTNLASAATSPSLPYSPILSSSSIQINRSYPCVQQQYSSYGIPTPEASAPVMQQPFIVYTTPYGVPVQQHYDSRTQDQSNNQELSSTYYLSEGTVSNSAQAISYNSQPTGSFWNQQPVSFYPNSPQGPATPQRFPVPLQTQSAYVPTVYPMNYMHQSCGALPQNPDLMPVYPNQSVQMVYSQSPTPNAAIVYQNQPPVIYAHNAATCSSAAFQPQALPTYGPGTPTPNICMSSSSNPLFGSSGPEDINQGYVQLAQNMQQMNLGAAGSVTPRSFVALNMKCPQPFDSRSRNSIPKAFPGKFVLGQQQQPGGAFIIGPGHSSNGANSPAAVIPTGYCSQGSNVPGATYRSPPDTPPTSQFVFQPGFNMTPRLFRQMSGERDPNSGHPKNSRSPTPANDFDRQRMSMTSNVYQVMPYVVHSDARCVGRGQPSVYRQTPPVVSRQSSINQGSEKGIQNRNRKSRGTTKAGGIPPSGN